MCGEDVILFLCLGLSPCYLWAVDISSYEESGSSPQILATSSYSSQTAVGDSASMTCFLMASALGNVLLL